MNQKVHNQIVSFIWGIADDVLRDVFVRGKYRDIILPFTVLRRLDSLLVPTKEKVLETNQFLIREKIDDKSALQNASGYVFWNISKFTFESLLNDAYNIDSNLEAYLDGYSPNVQEIISKFKLRNQLETMKEAGVTFLLIEKLAYKDINLSPLESVNGRGEKLPPLTNLGMGYVFEELIRKFNEDNNEEAGEHFTPREIIKLMTHILFLPVKGKITKGTYLVYDPACGSGGMLTEAEQFALDITNHKASFLLYGQEVNPETYAICTSDMLIKGEKPENIAYGSTLSKDGFPQLHFDFMLSNPPYGKTWKIDEDAIVSERGKKGKEIIKDFRFNVGLPTISDGQLLFLLNMVSKMKHNTDLGSRIGTVHNGSALFTGDAGGGESEIRKYIIESDFLECVIALPTNIFYNTGIPTYILILTNRKSEKRKGKIQLINAKEQYVTLKKALGDKDCSITSEQIEIITNSYLNFEENETSKIFPNGEFGFYQITVERPLRLAISLSNEQILGLRFSKELNKEMKWVYETYGEDVYSKIEKHKERIELHFKKEEYKLDSTSINKLFSSKYWLEQKKFYDYGLQIQSNFGTEEILNFNEFRPKLLKYLDTIGAKLTAQELKFFIDKISYKSQNSERVIKKINKDNSIEYEPDNDLRDIELIPLDIEIKEFYKNQILPYIPDAWIDYSKTTKGYEIKFAKFFYNKPKLKEADNILTEILSLKEEEMKLIKSLSN